MSIACEKACAKINICLDVTGKRDDGYHEIESVMLCVTLADDVIVESSDTPGITLTCSDPSLPCDERNLAYAAAVAFFEYTDITPSVSIHVLKKIPDKAGLAGGSADAAAVLRALNTLTGAKLSDEELREIAKKIGSDVIFCVSSDPSFVSGRGDIIDYCPPLPDCCVVVAKGNEGVKTPGAYRALDEMYGDYKDRGRLAHACLEAMESGELSAVADTAFNIFESVTEAQNPMIAVLKASLLRDGALLSLMSGSGSAVFGLFDSEEKARAACERIKNKDVWAVVCKPL